MKNIMPKNLKQAVDKNALIGIIVSSASVSLNFGFPSTWTAIITTLIFAVFALWLGDRIFNGMIRDAEHDVKGVYTALAAALLIMFVAWIFTYLATVWTAWEWIFMGIWFLLTTAFIKFIFFGEENLERRAWMQALMFAFFIGIVYIVAMYVASWITLFFEYVGLSQYYASIATTIIFALVVLVLMWVDRKRAGEVAETFGEVVDDVRDPDEWFGDLE